MSVFGNLLKKSGTKLIESIGNAIDKNVTSKEEKLTLKNQLITLKKDFITENQEKVTERHRIDMSSDSWLSKNIRPLSMIFTTLVISLFALFHKNIASFEIDKSYIDLFKSLLILQYSFYFGLRGAEKITDLVGKYKLKGRKDHITKD